jgi:hypothetical protein
MESEEAIIPLCLYTGSRTSYIGLPKKIRQNGQNQYTCEPHPYMDFVTIFYAINPDVKPNPTYTDLIGAKSVDKKTIEILALYDPYNQDVKNVVKFLAWLEPTDNTTPLYISKKGTNVYISLQKDLLPGYTEYDIPVIHVFTHPDKNYPKIGNETKKFNLNQKKEPIFTFSNSYGKCIPDPNSNLSLGQCLVLYNKNIANPENIGKYPDVLTYLSSTYPESRPVNKKINNNVWAILSVVSLVIFIIIIFLLNK